jgi:hypothetical protein
VNFVPIEDHEAAHAAAATVLGVGVDSFEFDSWGLDGIHGRTMLSHDDLTGLDPFEFRRTLGVIAYMPRLAFSTTRGASTMTRSSPISARRATAPGRGFADDEHAVDAGRAG